MEVVLPDCITSGKHSTTLTIQCKSGQGDIDVTAYVTGADDGVTALTGSYTVGYPTGTPTVAVSAPTSAAAGQSFTVTAKVSDARGPAPYRYEWGSTPRCTFDRLDAPTVSPTCSYDPNSPYATFTVEAYDAEGYYIAPGFVRVKITDGSAPGGTGTTPAVVPHLDSKAYGGYPTKVTGRVTDPADGRPVAGARVRLQAQWSGSSSWTTLATATSSSTGAVSFSCKTTRPGRFRLATVPTASLARQVSTALLVKVPTKASLAVSGRTLTARLTTGAGRSVAHAKAILVGRTSAGSAWRLVGAAKRTRACLQRGDGVVDQGGRRGS